MLGGLVEPDHNAGLVADMLFFFVDVSGQGSPHKGSKVTPLATRNHKAPLHRSKEEKMNAANVITLRFHDAGTSLVHTSSRSCYATRGVSRRNELIKMPCAGDLLSWLTGLKTGMRAPTFLMCGYRQFRGMDSWAVVLSTRLICGPDACLLLLRSPVLVKNY